MKTNHNQLRTALFAATMLVLLTSGLVRAEIVFDNTSNLTTAAAFSALPMGNQIRLSGTNRIVNEIDIGITRQGYPGTADFQLWFYANDGSGNQPGTLLWNSGLIDNLPLIGSSQIMAFAVPQILVPDTFTWELQISDSRGVNEMAVGQLCSSSSPTVGTYVDAWFGNPGSWGNDHFQRAARVVAIPEPATLLLLGLGAAIVRKRHR
jgi:hypothetical protein